jgi:arylsulfatase
VKAAVPTAAMIEAHLKTRTEHPPVQGRTSFDMSSIVQDFLRRSKQRFSETA